MQFGRLIVVFFPGLLRQFSTQKHEGLKLVNEITKVKFTLEDVPENAVIYKVIPIPASSVGTQLPFGNVLQMRPKAKSTRKSDASSK